MKYKLEITSELGDVMLCTFTLEEVRERYPQAIQDLESKGHWETKYKDKRSIPVTVIIKKQEEV